MNTSTLCVGTYVLLSTSWPEVETTWQAACYKGGLQKSQQSNKQGDIAEETESTGNNMKKLLLTSACVAALGMSQVANALSITPDSGILNSTRWEGNDVSQPAIDAAINLIVPGLTATALYKSDAANYDRNGNITKAQADSGPLSGNYTTVFDVTPEDPSKATITHNGGAFVGPTAYLLVKDGNATPAWYLFRLTDLTATTSWNGTDELVLTDFWPNGGAISHVTLYGSTGVPDGGATAVLLGFGMLGLGFMARRKA
ncbi:MAG: VPDSG-CTERM sorting domain-containing protein [Verrucomicrobiales bacterium]|nr:VPDSG-CTERM sorting domain-containing protein [Verrucomicrobiales bacterium]